MGIFAGRAMDEIERTFFLSQRLLLPSNQPTGLMASLLRL